MSFQNQPIRWAVVYQSGTLAEGTLDMSADNFRELNALTLPDIRQSMFVVVNEKTGTHRPTDVADIHKGLCSLSLSSKVPDDIRVHFDTARNLLLYSWFVYRFMQIAERQAYASAEMALRMKLPPDPKKKCRMLRDLLQDAVAMGIIRAEGFTHFREIVSERNDLRMSLPSEIRNSALPEPDAAAYLANLVEMLPALRNGLAHGNTRLDHHVWFTMNITCDLINQLYN